MPQRLANIRLLRSSHIGSISKPSLFFHGTCGSHATIAPRLHSPPLRLRSLFSSDDSNNNNERLRSPLTSLEQEEGGQRELEIMASDEDYMNFLNKANEDASGGGGAAAKSSGAGQHKFKTTDSGKQVPQAIQKAIKDEVYVTDADEPFEGVALKCEGGLPDEETFAKLINHPDPSSADIEIMDPTDWDVKGQYGKIVDAVREASKGADVRVYRVKRDGTRTEYWVLSTAEGGIVGAKALGVES